MNTKSLIKLLALHGATTLLFYHEHTGINLLIFHLLLFAWLVYYGRNKQMGETFVGLTALMTALAFGAFMANPPILYIYLLLLPYWVLSSRYKLQYLILLPLSAIFRLPMSTYHTLKSYWLVISRFGGDGSSLNKGLVKGITILLATGVLFVFIQFYSSANEMFGLFFKPLNLWVQNINLIEFMAFQLWMQLMIRNSSTAEDKLKPYLRNMISFFTDWLTEIMSNRPVEVLNTALNYLRTGLAVILTCFLAAEFYTLTQPLKSYADSVHQTFDSMIGSFSLTILVMGIERYFIRFRREMNTYASITYRLVIGFNLVLIGLTAYKDILYISSDYLTERRLELFIWLIFATALMLMILLSDQRKAQYHILLDRFVLIAATCISINAATPYQHLVLYSAIKTAQPEHIVVRACEAGFGQGGFSQELEYSLTNYGNNETIKSIPPSNLQNSIYRLSFKDNGLGYTGEMHLEIMILEEIKQYLYHLKHPTKQ